MVHRSQCPGIDRLSCLRHEHVGERQPARRHHPTDGRLERILVERFAQKCARRTVLTAGGGEKGADADEVSPHQRGDRTADGRTLRGAQPVDSLGDATGRGEDHRGERTEGEAVDAGSISVGDDRIAGV